MKKDKPPTQPDPYPISTDEAAGVDNGPCHSFRASPGSEVRCGSCGYLKAAH